MVRAGEAPKPQSTDPGKVKRSFVRANNSLKVPSGETLHLCRFICVRQIDAQLRAMPYALIGIEFSLPLASFEYGREVKRKIMIHRILQHESMCPCPKTPN